MKNILIGNGINSRLKIEQLYTDKIFERFVKNAKRYVPLFTSVFSDRITIRDIDDLFDKSSKGTGIEILARNLYKYIKDMTTPEKDIWSDNDEQRLQDILTCIAILSIFYDDKGLINPTIDKKLLPDLSRYDKVFTLNYFEFWDDKNISISLHGYIDFKKMEDHPNAFLYNPKRMNLQEYYDGIEKMKLEGNAVPFDSVNFVFAPEGVNKMNLTCISGIFPSGRLHPAEDLYLIEPKNLYEELKKITEIEVFGVSPYGDRDLINMINTIDYVKVYVHEMSRNSEKEAWENKLDKCSLEIEDALACM